MEKLDTLTKEMPQIKTYVSNVLHEVNSKVRYDTEVKKLLSDNMDLYGNPEICPEYNN